MTRAMTHDEAQAALGAAALDALPDEERRAVLAHAAACAECGPELAALSDAAASLAYLAPAAPLDPARSAAVRARLLARASADDRARRPRGVAGVAPPVPASAATRAARRWGASGWLALAASVAFLAAVAGLARVARERDALRAELRSATAAYAAQLDSARAALASGRRIVDALTGPEVKVVDLTAAGARPPVARMFWDRATNRWTMFAHHLPPPAAGRTYQLWLVTRDAKKISAGTFAPTPAGDALVSAEYPLAPTALQAVAVTEEPAGGVPQPTGPMVLVGTAGR